MKTTKTLFRIPTITAAKENYMKKTWPILLGLLLLAAPRAEAQFSYTTNTDRVTLSITGYAGPPWAVTIPTNINGMTVTGIGAYAFEHSSLTSVTIPRSITNIGDVPFVGCSSLETITVDSHNPAYSSVNGVLFDKKQTTLIEYPAGKLGSYAIPGGVASIGYAAFGDCYGLTSVTIPKGVTTINADAFYECKSLASVAIPGTVTNIGYAAFESCTNLASVTIPKGVTTISADAFYDCESLTSAAIPGTVASIGFEAFMYCYSMTNVTISKGVTSIGDYAFYDCEGLASVAIPGTVTGIGYEAFAYCYRLANLTISKGVTTIGEYAFYECKSLASVTLPSSLSTIEYEAFAYCYRLAKVCFEGSPPLDGYYVLSGEGIFDGDPLAAVFFVNGTTGWSPTYDGIPTEPCVQCGGAALATLIVLTNGLGTVSPGDNGALLAIGSNYTLTASPGKNWIFSSWVSSGSESFVSNNPFLKFTMKPNLTLTVNFVTNLFLASQGAPYNGLFAPANAPRQQTSSGAITFAVTKTGVLSGKLTIGSNTVSLNGQFNPAGAATIVTPRESLSTLTTTLQLDSAGQTATGSVTDGSFVAQVIAYLDVFSATHKAAHYEGQYTLIIPGTTDSTEGPFGTSYGTVTVSPLGVITFAWNLADGTSVSPQSSVVSKNGYWPLYLALYSGNGSIWSWLQFTNGAVMSGSNASWINAANPAPNALYPAGFTNEAASIFGSAFNSTDKPLLALTHGEVILEGGNLPFTITNQFTLAPDNAITLTNAADTNKLTLTIKTAGLITGSFADPSNPNQTITVNGVLLQNETNAAGYFLGTHQSGAFLLMPQ
jgi:hypothetical protein